ncbi:FtsW/RodA/SpoVE family cell cycle protein [Sunxiuqinia elliptica]|uniref:Probable peptidoglycan glycosyltransferase FtsW n=1 Tax=Sunxiuqinia elliptica TaxID=655355 RepID=A0A4R6HB09_9BACT|nr:FtsW/RodA/SpoVE family cell cycle protein [Sunxiuqinia elliptica]TDO04916.1 cell division protein FtsW [Sunxiuqinia elliptica]TDO64464.1 cell division protein FtsW [Sunxiuqinia elliptica]
MNFSLGKIVKGDRILWVVLVFLSLISLLIVYSATGKLAYREAGGNTGYYLVRQLIFLSAGFGVMVFLVNVIPVKFYTYIAPLLLLITIGALLAAVVQYKLTPSKPTPRSLDLGFLSFQPAELAKISLMMFVAKVLSKRQKTKEELRKAFFWVMGASGVVCGIIFYGDISTSALIFGSVMVLMMIARIPAKYLLMTIGAGLLLLSVLYFSAEHLPAWAGRVHTFKERIDDFVFGDDHAELGTTQADYAKLAIYEGGMFGKGPGRSEVSNYMEAAYNDFIYAIIIEEYGMFGGIFVALLYLILLYRGVVIVRRSNRTYPAFLTAGLVLLLVFQAVINMAVSVGVAPVTGQPLPWVSMGGTSMLFTAVSFGTILTVSYHNQRNKQVVEPPVMIDMPDEDEEL